MKNKRLLYVIDCPYCLGGAHIATRLLLPELTKHGFSVEVLGEDSHGSGKGEFYRGIPVRIVETRRYTFKWLLKGLWRKFFKTEVYPVWLMDPTGKIRRYMKDFDVVCCSSEESHFRTVISVLGSTVRKVQLIHTNYKAWLRHSGSARLFSSRDSRLYPNFDAIGVVGNVGVGAFEECIGACRGKVYPFHNIIDCSGLRYLPKQRCSEPLRLISLANLDDLGSKDGPRMVRLAKRLSGNGYKFVWDVYGGSAARIEVLQRELDEDGVGKFMRLHGYSPDARRKIAEADMLLLLSHYEGLPNSIYEALIAGTPVLATRVGGVPEQIAQGETGWLVEDDENAIYETLGSLIVNPGAVVAVHAKLATYQYDNNMALMEHIRLLASDGT